MAMKARATARVALLSAAAVKDTEKAKMRRTKTVTASTTPTRISYLKKTTNSTSK